MARKKKQTARDEELSTRKPIEKKLLDVYADIEKGFADQRERSDDIMDYWDLYNCKLGEKQFYSGNSRIFLPIIKDAIKARKTRFTNQIFPQSGRYVEVTTENGDIPHATMSLLEHYVRASRLRTQVVPALMVSGDVEGQYSVYVGWRETKRNVVTRLKEGVKIDGTEFPELGEIETVVEETITDAKPFVEVLADSDLLILPQTCDSVEDALEVGGCVTVLRRWSKTKIRDMMRDGEITREKGNALVKEMSANAKNEKPNTPKKLAEAAGIRSGGGTKYALIYETWLKLKIDGEHRICRVYYAGDEIVLGCKLNPFWCDKVPIISGPVNKIANVFKGKAPVADVEDVQVFANDTINEGADTAHFSAMPIIMTDPEKNPRVGSMILGLAAVWETNPRDTQFAQFPELWKSAFERVAACKTQIYESLGVNPAMIAQNTGAGRKRNQAEIANEQQVDILTTADAVINVEETILTPLLQRFAEYDHQFREEAIRIRAFGEMGLRAQMEEIPPIQMNNRFSFRWFGVEAARNAQQIQQQIGAVNVIRGIPPQQYQGYRLDLAPLLVQLAENVFGPRLAPLVFISLKDELSVPPELENQMLNDGFEVMVHPGDNDAEHLQAHMADMQSGDPSGQKRAHIIKHQAQMQQKAQAQQAMTAQGGMPGAPGGNGPGMAGTPKPGASPGQPHAAKQPNGAIPQDQMHEGMPRHM